jgi:hypothetical protein
VLPGPSLGSDLDLNLLNLDLGLNLDLNCIFVCQTCLEALSSSEHRLVVGADEKPLRVYDATNKVLTLLHDLCGIDSARWGGG